MNIPGYSAVEVSFGLPPQPETFDLKAELRGMLATGELFDQITADRNELARLRERVAGLLERNTSLVHAKRDLEAQVKALTEYNAHYRGAHFEGQLTIERLHHEIRCLKERVPYTTSKAGDIPIREVPIHCRRDAN